MKLFALLVLVALLVPGTASANVPYPPNWPLTLDVQVTDCDGAGLPDTFLLEYNNGSTVHLHTDAQGRFNEVLAAPHAASSFRLVVRSLTTDWYTTTLHSETFRLCYAHLPWIVKEQNTK